MAGIWKYSHNSIDKVIEDAIWKKPEEKSMFKLSAKPTVKELMPALTKLEGAGIRDRVGEVLRGAPVEQPTITAGQEMLNYLKAQAQNQQSAFSHVWRYQTTNNTL